MCGIVGYIGDRDLTSILLVGLERLSYRGYDSAGIAVISDGELSCWKKPGKIHALNEALKNMIIQGQVGIGHTRWATHGEPNEVNAHPQLSQSRRVAVVHNGIIENYLELKSKLKKEGHIFLSQTDTEIIVHLIERYLQDDLESAVELAAKDLVGSLAIAVVAEDDPDKIVVYKKGSPLVIGVGKGENYIASDVNAIISHTKNIIYLDDGELAIIEKNNYTIKRNGKIINKEIQTVKWDAVISDKNGYEHYMLKEIYEQAIVVRKLISKYLQNNKVHFKSLKLDKEELAKIKRFIIQACGTSWHSGLLGKYLIEKYTRIPTEVDISSEFRYRDIITEGNKIVVAISQSGETADTLACIREAKSKFFKVLSFVNVKGSSIDRESDGVIYTHSGPEIGVASTKNYVAQLVSLYLFMVHLGILKWTLDEEKVDVMLNNLRRLPEQIDKILQQTDHIKKIAKKYAKSKEFIFVGRGVNYPTALEGALKLKELSYIHAAGYPAGELKHGPIALIDENLPVVCIAPQSETYDKMISNIQEIRARKGKTIVIATEGDENIKEYADDILYIPLCPEDLTPILAVIPLQLLAYYIALELNCDVDQPRNLAKSVTVE
ncbi:glutamine--fructose-6-phosphate transaminase (isomerizing) [bacterium]|nr:glutamine--fructose-6-phosphate transaminase (isomerizing) [bacterium]